MDILPALRIPYISARVENGRVVVQVVDDELRDMVEDHLTEECDLGYEYLAPPVGGGKACCLVFSPEILLSEIIAALNELDAAEVERVFRLNN